MRRAAARAPGLRRRADPLQSAFMKHSPGFLNLVADAKSRVREIDVPEYLEWLDSGRQHVLIDTREESE